jgi:hypothetical protein
MKLDFVNDNENAMTACAAMHVSQAVKKPVEVGMFYIMKDTTFVNSSGEQHGKLGDIAIIGKDHAWPVSEEYFRENYVTVPGRALEEVK